VSGTGRTRVRCHGFVSPLAYRVLRRNAQGAGFVYVNSVPPVLPLRCAGSHRCAGGSSHQLTFPIPATSIRAQLSTPGVFSDAHTI